MCFLGSVLREPVGATGTRPMPTEAPAEEDRDDASGDTWPWACLECGTTIYHDGDWCRDCASTYQVDDGGPRRESSDGFVDWMCRQSASAFVAKVTVLAGFELLLTAFWLQQVLPRIAELGRLLLVAT